MTTGMLWFDNSKLPLEDKIKKAATYYEKKYGTKPEICMVHPKMGEANVEGLEILPYRPVLPGHLWIGMKDV